MTSEYQQVEQERRGRNFGRDGTIFEVDYSGSIPLYRVKDGKLESGWLMPLNQRSGGDREADFYEMGEQVAFFMIAGGDSRGYILGSVPQAKYPVPEHTPDRHARYYKDGAIVRYDRLHHHYEINLPAGATVEINASGGVVMNATEGNVNVNGDVIADGVSLKHHKHDKVKTGNAVTGEPI